MTSGGKQAPAQNNDTYRWQIAQSLYELFAAAPNLQSGLEAALPRLLKALEAGASLRREFGAAIVARETGEPQVQVAGQHNLPQAWAVLLAQPRSPLAPVLNRLLAHAETLDRRAIEALLAAETIPQPPLVLALPLTFKDQVQGALLITGADLTAEDRQALEQLAQPFGLALFEAQKDHLARRQARRFDALQKRIIRLSFDAQLEELHTDLVNGICQVLDTQSAGLTLIDPENAGVAIRRTLFIGRDWTHMVEPQTAGGIITACIAEHKTLRVDAASRDPRFQAGVDAPPDLEVKSLLCAPLVVGERTFGALTAINKQSGPFNVHDQDLLTTIAGLAAQAIYGTVLIQEHKVANADLEASHWELLHSRNTLRALFDSMPAALYIINRQYRLAAVNMFCAERIQQTPRDLVNQLCYRALYGRSEPCPGCKVIETFTTGQVTLRHDQHWFAAEEPTEWAISAYPIRNETEEVVQAILLEQDVTEKRRLESILAQSEKLAAVGQLAAGVAHEINNPLTAILANAQILQRELPPDHEAQESIELIARAGARAAQVVRNLLDFARRETYHLAPTDINETLRRSVALIQHEFLVRAIQLDFRPGENLPPVLASQDHLQGVWLNLLLNALDALDADGGKIEVITTASPGMVQVNINDTGKGIPPERLERIFEPFYTTKGPGRGTGLGLSVVHRVIKQHGGHIMVKSELGVGSEFTVVLPIAE